MDLNSVKRARNPLVGRRSSGVLQTEVVVDRMAEFLLAAEVTLRRLNRCMAEQELYLLQFSTGQVAQPGASTSQIVRGKVLDPSAVRNSFHNMPDRLRREPNSPEFAHAVYTTEDRAGADFGGCGPSVNHPFTHAGTGTVRICFPLPINSVITQCSSRNWKSSTLSATNSARRKPHPIRTARIALSR